LDARKLAILNAIIDDYILTAAPVGSRTLSRKDEIGGLSSATIRNEMSDLEALGYLDQPHTSAGRVPSAKAYRLYVQRLLSLRPELGAQEAAALRGHLTARASQVRDVIRQAAQAVADATQYATIVTEPKRQSLKVRRVQLVPISDDTALMVLVTDGGVFKDATVRFDARLSADYLLRVSEMLSRQLEGTPLSKIEGAASAMLGSLREHEALMHAAIQTIRALGQVASGAANGQEIVLGGATNILQYPEYADAEKARQFLTALENGERLRALLAMRHELEFTLHIGPETGMPELEDCSLVTATYRVAGGHLGTLGVIGPKRMRYGHVLGVLGFVGGMLGELLDGQA